MSDCENCSKAREIYKRMMALLANPGECRSCGAKVYWVTTRSKGPREDGKAMPMDADGKSHFATCPNANQHRRT